MNEDGWDQCSCTGCIEFIYWNNKIKLNKMAIQSVYQGRDGGQTLWISYRPKYTPIAVESITMNPIEVNWE